MSDINAKVVEIVVERLNVGADTVTAESSFINDLGADSLDIVELVMEFEEAFDMTIPDEDSENIRTVGEAVSYIESKADGGGGDAGGDDGGAAGGDAPPPPPGDSENAGCFAAKSRIDPDLFFGSWCRDRDWASPRRPFGIQALNQFF